MARVSEGERDAFTPCSVPSNLAPGGSQPGASTRRADEVAQAAMIKLFTHATSFTPGRPALPWFYTVVANEGRAELRRGPGGEARRRTRRPP